MNFYLDEASRNLNSPVGPTDAIPFALTGILDLLVDMQNEHIAEKKESERMNRDGEWVTEWFVEVPPRKPIRFDDEESAYDGARRAAATDGIDPETVVVFCTEVKRFKREEVARAEWESA